mgnify:FL=1|jgi:hypothetical protein
MKATNFINEVKKNQFVGNYWTFYYQKKNFGIVGNLQKT